MTVKVPEKNGAARWIQAAAITCVLYLMMVMSQPQSASTVALDRQSNAAAADLARLAIDLPSLLLMPVSR